MGSEKGERELTDREKHLRWARQGYPQKIPSPSDSAPEVGGTLHSRIRGLDLTRPITTQPLLTPTEEPLKPTRRIQTSKGSGPLQPIDQLAVEASQGFQDPATLKKARKQLFAKYGRPGRRKDNRGRR